MKKAHIYFFVISILLSSIIILFYLLNSDKTQIKSPLSKSSMYIKSIDTMKYSRDYAREKSEDPSFDSVIDEQVRNIAKTGANYIALGTPYDDEFVGFLKKWVKSARRYNLHIWYRGNFSGWENWFGYSSITRAAHIKKIEKFILNNPDIFRDGDIFTPCSECENGGSGDPRKTGDVKEYRDFLIAEYNVSQRSFMKINKKVNTGYFSMNFDVAKLVMDRDTTRALGGIVVIDHYVDSPSKLAAGAKTLANETGGKIIFGEIGAPIPDLNGEMNENQQATWINEALASIFSQNEVIGLNYWVNTGGSTEIWKNDGSPKKSVDIIQKYYRLN